MKLLPSMKLPKTAAPASDFFATREGLVSRIAELDRELAAATESAAKLLATGVGEDAPDLTEKLSTLNATKGSLTQLRASVAAQLDRHDKQGFARAADDLVGKIVTARQACLQEIAALIRQQVGWIFGEEDSLSAAERAERASKLDDLMGHTIHVRAELRRHFPLLSFADHKQSIPLFMSSIPAYRKELAACQERISAISEMRSGRRAITHDLSRFESRRDSAAPRVNLNYDPPESESAFAARRAARLADFEARLKKGREEQMSERELKELIGSLHPDRDPTFKRYLGTN